ncbi:hypothetical protein PHYPSEUDO_010782 [Phytophthora pseudosyringae]|uniref:Uncharacterized protein n=1 Tax=Phytophthora pseudosyringae TaxID=221518 RepID=A0A8T1WAF1_9STRA|nr:hypothetical protein PHYPSEUDO_010782 [Phytophthora pseudosyringae]
MDGSGYGWVKETSARLRLLHIEKLLVVATSPSSMVSSRQLVLLVGLLLAVVTCLDEVASQFAGNPAFFGNPQAIPQMATRAPMSSSSSVNSTSDSSLSGSMQGSKASSTNHDSSGLGSESGGDSSNDGRSESAASEGSGDDSGSGSWSIGSGSSSSSLEYGCDCRSVRRVSLMGASDYCLDPNASLSSKCGNVDLGESGACPITGAQPCSPKGHVLANDSLCALDDKDETYKCVASKKDLDIQKHGKKKKNKSGRRGHGSDSSMSTAPSHLMLTARQVLAIVVCVAAGVMAVV